MYVPGTSNLACRPPPSLLPDCIYVIFTSGICACEILQALGVGADFLLGKKASCFCTEKSSWLGGKSAPQAKIFTEFHGKYAENVKKIL